MNQAVIDCYKILQVSFSAGKEDIVSSYKRLCKVYHPDINPDPGAEEIMKQINSAYYILCDDLRREAYNSIYPQTNRTAQHCQADSRERQEEEKKRRSFENENAASAMDHYFDCLLRGDYHTAYGLLSNYDRQYVTIQSFGKWRESVSRLYSIRSYSITLADPSARVTLDDGTAVGAKKFSLNVAEKNLVTQDFTQYEVDKFVINEDGKWKVFLGYRDLNEIAQMFQQISRQQELGEMEKHWESFCVTTCRELDMLSRTGLVEASSKEIYRYRRYKQPMTVAVFSIKPTIKSMGEGISASTLEFAASALRSHLREIDIPAYMGDGVFAVIFVELKKRYCNAIVKRAESHLESQLGQRLGRKARVESCFEQYNGQSIDEILDRLIRKV